MAESCPTTFAKLSWLQVWHIRDDTYSAALTDLINTQFRRPFAGNWGDGSTSSSDGQRFKVGGKAENTDHINPKYGAEPGRMFYTHISDQYAPRSAKVVNVGVRDSTYVLDGLLYHEIGGTLNIKHVRAHWDEVLRLSNSVKQGTVTASLMLGQAWPLPRLRTA